MNKKILILSFALILDFMPMANTHTSQIPSHNKIISEQNTIQTNIRKKPLTGELIILPKKLFSSKIYATINIHIDPHWHINSNQPNQKYLIPTNITLLNSPTFEITKIKFPKPSTLAFPGLKEKVLIYKNNLKINIQLKRKEKSISKKNLQLQLSFQPCENTKCLPPDQMIFKTKL